MVSRATATASSSRPTPGSRPWWRWTTHYSYARIQLTKKPGSLDGSQEQRNEGLTPRHQVLVHASIDLPGAWTMDGFVRHVSALRAEPVDAYTTADVRLAWQVSPSFEVAIVGRDLGQSRHVEWPGEPGAGIERSACVSLTFRR